MPNEDRTRWSNNTDIVLGLIRHKAQVISPNVDRNRFRGNEFQVLTIVLVHIYLD